MRSEIETKVFLVLVRAALFGKDIQLFLFGNIDYNVVYQLAEGVNMKGGAEK